MSKFMRLATTVLTTLIAVSILSDSAMSGDLPKRRMKPEERFVSVGENANGETMLLDLASIEGTTEGIVYDTFIKYKSGMLKSSFAISCAERRIFLTQLALYSESGTAIEKDDADEEVSQASPESPVGMAMRVVCRRSGVAGY